MKCYRLAICGWIFASDAVFCALSNTMIKTANTIEYVPDEKRNRNGMVPAASQNNRRRGLGKSELIQIIAGIRIGKL